MKQIRACGVVVYFMHERDIHYVLIQNKAHGSYGFPKGHQEDGESDEETALREVYEEIGINITLHEDFKTQKSYKLNDGTIKNVVYFMASTDEKEFTIQEEEISDLVILPFDEAYDKLNFDSDKAVLKLVQNVINLNI